MALLNLLFGLWVDKLPFSDKAKSLASWAAILTFFLPIGLALKGASEADPNFPPIGLVGILAFLYMAVFLVIGGLKLRKETSVHF